MAAAAPFASPLAGAFDALMLAFTQQCTQIDTLSKMAERTWKAAAPSDRASRKHDLQLSSHCTHATLCSSAELSASDESLLAFSVSLAALEASVHAHAEMLDCEESALHSLRSESVPQLR